MTGRQRTVLITGAGGQLGQACQADFELAGWRAVAADHAALDIADRDQVREALHGLRPDAVVNAAAYTDVDGCETNADHAFRINALGPRHLAEACDATGVHLCHVSTDYVFDGTKPSPYTEWDRPNPASIYGQSKYGGEQEVLSAGIGATVARTAWVCGPVGHNLLLTVLRLAADPDRPLAFVDDQRGCPTFTTDLAVALRRLVTDRRPGLFHATNQGATSWFGFVREVLAAAGQDPERVRPIRTADLDPPRPALRPANSVLDNVALRASGLPLLPPWEESLPSVLKAAASPAASAAL